MRNNFLTILSLSALSLIFCIFLTAVLFFFFNIAILPSHCIFASILSLISVSLLTKNFKKALFAHIINFIIIFILALYFSFTMDFTADTLVYHLDAINLLKSGWNPLDLNLAYNPSNNWIKYFPKAPWIVCAVFAKFFSNLESSKLLGVFLMYTCALFLYNAVKTYTNNKILSIVLALLAAFNTVSMAESFTFLVDGVLSSLLIIYFVSIALYIKTRDKVFLYSFIMALCLVVNTKLMAIAYVSILGFGAFYFIKKDKKYIISFFASVFVSLFILGYNPYTVNTIKHYNPFYPIGSKDIEIVPDSCPKEIEDKFRITKFAISLFSEAGSIDEAPKLKIPFTITKKDLKLAHSPQLYMEGFGYLFSGALIIALIGILISYRKKDYKNFLVVLMILLASVLINPECWWARFVPQFYLFPLICALYFVFDTKDKKYLLSGYVLIFVLFLNMILTGFFHYKKVLEHQKIQNELTFILARFNGDIYVNKTDARIEGIRVRLNDKRIKYKEMDGFSCENGQELKYSTIKLCLTGNN